MNAGQLVLEIERLSGGTGPDLTHGEAAGQGLKAAIHLPIGVDCAGYAGIAAACHRNTVFNATKNGMRHVLLGLGSRIKPGIVGLVHQHARPVLYRCPAQVRQRVLKTDQR